MLQTISIFPTKHSCVPNFFCSEIIQHRQLAQSTLAKSYYTVQTWKNTIEKEQTISMKPVVYFIDFTNHADGFTVASHAHSH